MTMDHMDHESRAADIDAMQAAYAQTLYSLRESRKAILAPYAVDDEASLLEKIRSGDVDEHPAYESYLGASIIGQARTRVREQLTRQLSGAAVDVDAGMDADIDADIGVHALLLEGIEAGYAHRLSEPVRVAQDALLVFFDSGLIVEARYFSADEYAISWSWGEAQLRIDTAPVHPQCGSFPHHLHDDSGQLRADGVTRPGAPCWSNFSSLIDALLIDPLLEPGDEPT